MAEPRMKLLFQFVADKTGLSAITRQFPGVVAAARKMAAGVKSAFNGLRSAAGFVGAQFAKIRTAAIIAAGAITAVGIKAVKSFMEAEDQTEDLRDAIDSLGYSSADIMPKMQALAAELQLLTRVGDEETYSMAAMLLNFGVMPDKLEQAIIGTVGLAKAMRMDQGSAAKMVALAMQGQFDMLARYVPALKNAETEAEKMAILQRTMASGFDQAQASAERTAGRFAQLKNRIGDLWERLGESLAKGLDLTGAFHGAERAVAAFIESPVFVALEAKLKAFRQTVADLWTGITEGGQAAQFGAAVKNLFVGSLKLAGEKLVELLLIAAPMIGAAIGHAVKAAATNLNPFKAAGSWFGAQDAAMRDPEYARKPGESRTDMAARRWDLIQRYKKDIDAGGLKNQGLALSDQFAQDTNPELAAAFAQLGQTALKGRNINNARAIAQFSAAVDQIVKQNQDFMSVVERLHAQQQSLDQRLDQLKSQVKHGPRK